MFSGGLGAAQSRKNGTASHLYKLESGTNYKPNSCSVVDLELLEAEKNWKNSSNMVKLNFLFNLFMVEGLLLFNSLQLLSGSFRGILTWFARNKWVSKAKKSNNQIAARSFLPLSFSTYTKDILKYMGSFNTCLSNN